LGFFFFVFGLVFVGELIEELAHDAFWAAYGGVIVVLEGWGEEALFEVGGDLFDLRRGGVFGVLAGEVGAGDLEAVEEQAGAAGVDGVGGDGLEDLADGLLDGGAVFGDGEVEGGLAGLGVAWVGLWGGGWCGGSSRSLRCGAMGCRSGGRR
jgi:hypothetical protein